MLIYEPLSLLSYAPCIISGWTKPLPVARSLIRQTQSPDDQAGAKTVVQVTERSIHRFIIKTATFERFVSCQVYVDAYVHAAVDF